MENKREQDVKFFYNNVSEQYDDHDNRVCDKILEAGGGIGRLFNFY